MKKYGIILIEKSLIQKIFNYLFELMVFMANFLVIFYKNLYAIFFNAHNNAYSILLKKLFDLYIISTHSSTKKIVPYIVLFLKSFIF